VRNDGSVALSGYNYYLKSGDHTTGIISSVRYGTGNNITEQVKYRYDKSGNISRIYVNGKLAARYEYDALNRLIREDNEGLNKTTSYSYDNNGNLLSKREYNYTEQRELSGEKKEIIYGYDGGYWKDLLTEYDGETLEYDEMCNPVKYRGRSMEWEKGRRLKKIINQDGTEIRFSYDAGGLRTEKNGKKYIYEGGRLLRESEGSQIIDYIYDERGVAGIKLTGEKTGIYYYRKNIQGDVTHIYKSNGELSARYEYNAWGECKVHEENGEGIGELNAIRYRSYYYDKESGLYYLNSRYYDAEIGRFINADDIEIVMLTKDHVNGIMMYNYCSNNPVMYSDESGCMPEWAKWLIGGIVILGLGIATIATGGAAAGVAGFILAGAFKGAVIGAVSGALVTGTIGGISSAVSGDGFWSGFAKGAANGFMSGAIIGGVTGAISSSVQVANAAKSWASAGGKTSFQQMTEHYTKHVINEGQKSVAKNIVNYTKQAKIFFANNNTSGYLIRKGVIKIAGAPGGIFNVNGLIRSFWYVLL